MSTATTGRHGAYLRSAIAASASGLIKAFNTNKTSWIGLAVFLVVALLAILAPVIAPYDPVEQNILFRLKPPSAEHHMGTDYYGRDTFSRLLYGARISLVIGLLAIGAAMVSSRGRWLPSSRLVGQNTLHSRRPSKRSHRRP